MLCAWGGGEGAGVRPEARAQILACPSPTSWICSAEVLPHCISICPKMNIIIPTMAIRAYCIFPSS